MVKKDIHRKDFKNFRNYEKFIKQKMNSSKKDLKILFLAGWYPSRINPMQGIFIKKHAEAVSRFCDVSVLYVIRDAKLKDNTFELKYCIENKVKTIRIYYKTKDINIPVLSYAYKLLRYIKLFYIGFKTVKEKSGTPDIVHVNVIYRTGFFSLFLKFINRINYIVTEHSTEYLLESEMEKNFIRRLIARLVVKNAKAVTTVSESLKNAMIKRGLKNKYFIVPNVVDTNIFYPIRPRYKGKKKRFLHVSLLDDRKNVSGIINVMKKLSETRNDFELHIIGEGENRKKLEKLSKDLSIKNSYVFFHGAKNTQEVADIMRSCDCLIIFSYFENLPCIMIEAMASGLPIISTDVGGISEHINKERGVLIQPSDEEAFIHAANYMLDNYFKYNTNKIRNYAVENFSYDVIGNRFLNIYKSI
jgi:glycosyltransferase involved in cell wall biosynthesis